MALHFGNAYQPDDDTMVIEAPAYDLPMANPFEIFLNKYLEGPAGITGWKHGSTFKRFILNLKTKEVKMENLIHSEYGSIDLLNYNPNYDMVAKNRYTYFF